MESACYCLVLVTAPEEDSARKIAARLVEEKLAACVNLIPGVNSLYRWEGEVEEDREVLLIIKSRTELIASHLVPLIHSLHPYQVPEVIALPIIAGSQEYLDWLGTEVITGEGG
jgi:periplasmic divalent cation tolerance protein